VKDGPRTLSVDCGGTGMKCLVLDDLGEPISTRVRLPTPYPCPPDAFVDTIERLASAVGMDVDRVSVGMPGLVRHGVVRWTPHYVTECGPFSPIRSDLALLWQDLDIRTLLESTLDRPTRVVNDAELAGLSVISGRGYEVMLTLGTGLGFAHYSDGAVLPKIEVSAAPFRKGRSFDERLGHHARKARGSKAWSSDVQRALRRLYAVFSWDRAYLGGGGSKHLRVRVDEYVTLVGNRAGILGGVRLWDEANSLGVIEPLPATDD
jgi:polyphosphate glucokinase